MREHTGGSAGWGLITSFSLLLICLQTKGSTHRPCQGSVSCSENCNAHHMMKATLIASHVGMYLGQLSWTAFSCNTWAVFYDYLKQNHTGPQWPEAQVGCWSRQPSVIVIPHKFSQLVKMPECNALTAVLSYGCLSALLHCCYVG